MKGADHMTFTTRYHELVALVPKMVPTLENLIDRYVAGLPSCIQSIVLAAYPATLESAISLSANLTIVMVRSGVLKDDAGKAKETTSKKPEYHQKKKQKVIKNYAAVTPLRQAPAAPVNPVIRGYGGERPQCTHCKYHHPPAAQCRKCTNCGRFGHWVTKCRVAVNQATNTAARALPPPPPQNPGNNNNRGCYNRGEMGHFSRDCPKRAQPGAQAPRGRAFQQYGGCPNQRLKLHDRVENAQRLNLPDELSGVHDVFHVSNLKKCLADETLIIPVEEIQLDEHLRFVEEPLEIMNRKHQYGEWPSQRLKLHDRVENAQRLNLPDELSGVHDVFHVSNLKKCLADETLIIPIEEIQLDGHLRFVEEPLEIMNRKVKKLRRSRIPIVKVRWNSRRGPEFTWECEDHMKTRETVTSVSDACRNSDRNSNSYSNSGPDFEPPHSRKLVYMQQQYGEWPNQRLKLHDRVENAQFQQNNSQPFRAGNAKPTQNKPKQNRTLVPHVNTRAQPLNQYPNLSPPPPCTICGKPHRGICRFTKDFCFRCGQTGHLVKDCPQPDTLMITAGNQAKTTTCGRVFALTAQDAAQTPDFVTGLPKTFKNNDAIWTDDQSERTIQTLEDMLRACALEWTGNWDEYFCLV
ncbi:hypothetical protein E3N88_18657 [Mikania micrantha]|uniref:CCHC-type domain-containing protein n=1 Tax=Mikania micrantha TaxID=192012 RepID=A0A5N6NL11_9ASTR|nr:hypothetical protein E3N88_18657 [Mikania micrantha]